VVGAWSTLRSLSDWHLQLVHLQLDGPDVLTFDFLLVLIEGGCFSISLFICQVSRNVGLDLR